MPPPRRLLSQADAEDAALPEVLLPLRRHVREIHENDLLFNRYKGYYIPPDVALQPGQVQSTEGRMALPEFLAREGVTGQASLRVPHLTWLFGDSGAGKTTALMQLESDLWANVATGGLVPIRIILNDIPRRDREEDFLKDYLLRCGYTAESLRALRRECRFCLLLDGYDELVLSQGLRNLLEDSRFLTLQSDLIFISGRTQSERDARHIDLYARERGLRIERRYLCPFTPAQIDRYLESRLRNPTDDRFTPEVVTRMDRLPGLRELVTNPLLLRIVVDILPNWSAEEVEVWQSGEASLTRYAIYETFTKKWFELEFIRLLRDKSLVIRGSGVGEQVEKLLAQYACKIALYMFQRNQVTVSQAQLAEEERAFLHDVFHEEAANEFVDRLRMACPLKKAGQSAWQFGHKSFQEFLTAQWLWMLADLPEEAAFSLALRYLQAQPGQIESPPQIQAEPQILEFLYEAWQTRGERIHRLRALFLKVVEHSKFQPEIYQASANAATLLNAMAEPLNGLPWAGVQLQGADLSYGRLWHVDLSGANLTGACIAHAILVNANLSNAVLTDVKLGQAQTFKVDKQIKAFAKHPSKPWVALGQDKSIALYDYNTGEIVGHTLEGHTHTVMSLAFNRDGSLLVSAGGYDKSCRLWQWQEKESHYAAFGRPVAGHSNEITCVAFDRTGEWFASGSTDKTCRLWRVSDRQLLAHWRSADSVTALAFSPTENVLAVGTKKNCQFLELPALTPHGALFEMCNHEVKALLFSADGEVLVSGGGESRDGLIWSVARFWRVSNQVAIGKKMEIRTGYVAGLAFSPDGSRFVFAGGGHYRIYRVSDQEPMGLSFEAEGGQVIGAAFTEDGVSLISAAVNRALQLWPMSDRILVGRPNKPFIVCSNDRELAVIQQDKETGQLLLVLQQFLIGRPFKHEGRSLHFSPQKTWLASLSDNNKACDLRRVLDQVLMDPPLKEGRNSAAVLSVAFRPDGRWFASGYSDGTCRFWDVSTHLPIGEVLEGHTSVIHSLAFSPDGTLLASASIDKTCRLWRVADQTLLAVLEGHTSGVLGIAFSPDGRLLASASADKTCRLWRLGDPREVPVFMGCLEGHSEAVTSIAFHPRLMGKQALLASGSVDKTCRLWRARDRRQFGDEMRGHKLPVRTVAFSPDGRLLASGSVGDRVYRSEFPGDVEYATRLWQASNQQPFGLPLQALSDIIVSVAFSPDGSLLAAAGFHARACQLWRLETQLPVARMQLAGGAPPTDIAFSPEETDLLVMGDQSGKSHLWKVSAQTPWSPPLEERTSPFQCVSFSSDEQLLASGHDDGSCRLWRVLDRLPVGRLMRGHEGSVGRVVFSPDNTLLCLAGSDFTCSLWRVEDQGFLGRLSGHEATVYDLAFSPADQDLVVTASADRTCRVWRVSDQALIHSLQGHTNSVYRIAFSPDGLLLATTSFDKTCRLWRVSTWETIRVLTWSRDMGDVVFLPLRAADLSTEVVYRLGWSGDDAVWCLRGADLEPTLEDLRVVATTPFMAQGMIISDAQGLAQRDRQCLLEKQGAYDAAEQARVAAASAELQEQVGMLEAEAAASPPRVSTQQPVVLISETRFSVSGDLARDQSRARSLWELGDLPEAEGLSVAIAFLADRPIQSEPTVLECLYEHWQMNAVHANRLRSLLEAVVERSREDPAIAQSSANAATVLNAMAESLNDLDWHAVQLPGADLSYGRLWNTNLSGANLSGACLAHAVLVGADLRRADLRELCFDEDPRINTKAGANALAWHPQRPWLVLSQGNSLVIYDKLTGQAMGSPLLGHAGEVRSVVFSVTGEWLVSGSQDKTCRVWQFSGDSYTFVRVLEGHTEAVTSLAFNSQDLLVSGSEDFTCRLWDMRNPSAVSRLLEGHGGAVLSVAFSSDGHFLASGSRDWTCRVWRIGDGSPADDHLVLVCEGHHDEVVAVAFHPDGTLLASGSKDKHCWLWPLSGQTDIARLLEGYEATIRGLAFSPDGALLALSDSGQCELFRVSDRRPVRDVFKVEASIQQIAFSPCGKFIALASSGGYGVESACQFWRVSGAVRVGRFWERLKAVYNARFNSEGTLLATTNGRDVYGLWRVPTELRSRSQGADSDPATSDATHRIFQGFDNSCQLWKINESTRNGGASLALDSPVDQAVPLLLARYRQDGNCEVLSLADQGSVRHTVRLSFDPSIVFNSAGSIVASRSSIFVPYAAGPGAACQLWDVSGQTPQPSSRPLVGHLSQISSFAFSPDGSLLASGGQDGCRLWSLQRRATLCRPLVGHAGGVRSLAFHPEGKWLVSGGMDGVCRLWDVDTQEIVGSLGGHTGSVNCVAFSPDGKLIATGGYDKTCRVWRTSDQACLHVMSFLEWISNVCFAPQSSLGLSGQAYRLTCGGGSHLSLWAIEGEAAPRLELMTVTADMPALMTRGINMAGCRGLSAMSQRLLEQYGLDEAELSGLLLRSLLVLADRPEAEWFSEAILLLSLASVQLSASSLQCLQEVWRTDAVRSACLRSLLLAVIEYSQMHFEARQASINAAIILTAVGEPFEAPEWCVVELPAPVALLEDIDVARLDALAAVASTAALASSETSAHDEVDYHRYSQAVFYERVNAHGSRLAIVMGGEQLTYAELNRRSNQLAHFLLLRNIKPEDRVALVMDKSIEFFVSVLAVIKSGAAFVLLELPQQEAGQGERFTRCLEGSISSAHQFYMLAQRQYEGLLRVYGDRTVYIDDPSIDACIKAQPDANIDPVSVGLRFDSLAYITFTSGSSGFPKGPMIEHEALFARFIAHDRLIHLTSEDRIAQFAPAHIDAVVMEMLMAWLSGACLVVVPLNLSMNALKIYYNEHHVTVSIFTPSVLEAFSAEDFPVIRAVLTTGEAVSLALLKAWHDASKTVINGYGPSETTIGATLWQYAEGSADVAIGTAMLGLDVKVYPIVKVVSDAALATQAGSVFVDDFRAGVDRMLPVAEGIMGEICIFGAGVARGYCNDEVQTRERFFRLSDGRRLYKTGDKGCVRDGLLFIDGRLDRQTKKYGRLISPDEVEAVMKEFVWQGSGRNIITQAVFGKDPQTGLLIARIKLEEGFDVSHAQAVVTALASYVSERLERFMLPQRWWLDQGTMGNWKFQLKDVPRDRLYVAAHANRALITRRDAVASILTEIWEQVLFFETNANPNYTIGLEDNFYYLGGDSLLFKKLVSYFSEEFNIPFPVDGFNREPTIAHLAGVIYMFRSEPRALRVLNDVPSTEGFPPLYFVHPLLGDAMGVYSSIARATHRRVYGINSRSLEEPNLPADLDLIAQDYCRDIEAKHHNPPYILIGWSAGGVIVHMMAEYWRQKNIPVITMMFDSVSPQFMQHTLSIQEHAKYVADLIKEIYNVLSFSGSELDLRSLEYHPSRLAQLKEGFKLLRAAGFVSLETEKILRAAETIVTAILVYQGENAIAEHELLVVARDQFARQEPTLAWAIEDAERSSRLITVPGNHLSIVSGEGDRIPMVNLIRRYLPRLECRFYLEVFIKNLQERCRSQRSKVSPIPGINLQAMFADLKSREEGYRIRWLSRSKRESIYCYEQIVKSWLVGELKSEFDLVLCFNELLSMSYLGAHPSLGRMIYSLSPTGYDDLDKFTHLIERALETIPANILLLLSEEGYRCLSSDYKELIKLLCKGRKICAIVDFDSNWFNPTEVLNLQAYKMVSQRGRAGFFARQAEVSSAQDGSAQGASMQVSGRLKSICSLQ